MSGRDIVTVFGKTNRLAEKQISFYCFVAFYVERRCRHPNLKPIRRKYGHIYTLQRVGSFTYITEGGVIHIHYRGWGHSHTLQRVGSFSCRLQRVGSFTFIVEGGVIHIHCRGWGHSHTLQRVGTFTYIAEGGIIHIHCRGWGH